MFNINGLYFHYLWTQSNQKYVFFFFHNIKPIPYIIGHGEFALHNRGRKRYGCHVVGFQNMIQDFGSCVYSPNDSFPTQDIFPSRDCPYTICIKVGPQMSWGINIFGASFITVVGHLQTQVYGSNTKTFAIDVHFLGQPLSITKLAHKHYRILYIFTFSHHDYG